MGIKINDYQIKPTAKKNSNTDTGINISELLNKDIQLFGNGFGAKRKETFFSNLKILLSSGLDIQRALELFIHSENKKGVKAIVEEIRNKIIAGDSLSKALEQSGKFSDYEVYSIRIGEESGQLLEVLDELSIFFNKTIKFRQQLISALSYPLFVIGFSVLVVVFLLNYLVPLFSDIYGRMGGELPSMTLQVMAMSDWVKANLFWAILVFSGIVGALYLQRSKIWFKKSYSFLLIKMPVLGGIFKLIYLSRFCQSMYVLLKARVPLLTAVNLVKDMIDFYPIQNSLLKSGKEIMNGVALSEALQKERFYPKQMIALIEVGEEAGNLENMFKKLADQYNESVEQKTKVIGSLLEPILIIGVGLLVGSILIAMYLPLFQMSTGMGG